MILMINGAFGVGKTSTAEALHEKMANSMIFDPEMIGGMLRYVIPHDIQRTEATTGDFQDFLLWKELTVNTAKRLVNHYGLHLIVPMTIREPAYFEYIYNGFKEISDTHHFCLMASKETIHQRLKERGEEEGRWCYDQTDKCLTAYENNDFGEVIDTENQTIAAVVNYILNKTQ